MKSTILFILSFILVSSLLNAQNVSDYLNIGKTITFNKEIYYLGWSSNPLKNYYIEEYFPKDEIPEKYNKMFTVSVIINDKVNVEEAVKTKIYELEQRKNTDALCNYIVLKKDKEYILDFLVSDSNGKDLNIVECNIQYYKLVNIDGKKAIQLNFYSHRAYSDNITQFLKNLKTEKEKWIEEITKTEIVVKNKF